MKRFLILLALLGCSPKPEPAPLLPPEDSILEAMEEARAEIEVQDRTIQELRDIIHKLEAKLAEPPAVEPSVVPAAAPASAPVAKITMESIDNCRACMVSDAKDAPRYRAAGWVWETVKVRAMPGRMYPRYRVCLGDMCEVVEIRNLSELDPKIRALLDRRAQ